MHGPTSHTFAASLPAGEVGSQRGGGAGGTCKPKRFVSRLHLSLQEHTSTSTDSLPQGRINGSDAAK